MALIKCPECGKDVSDTVESCIHCGFVLKKSVEEPEKPQSEVKESDDATILPKDDLEKGQGSSVFKFLIATAGVLAAFFVFAMIMTNIAGDSEPSATTVEQTTAPVVDMDLKIISGDCEKNEIVARETHVGMRYRIIAEVNRVTEDYVKVSPLNIIGSYAVYLYYSAYSQGDFARSISKGDVIIFEGTLATLHSSIRMDFKNVVFTEKCS